MNRGQFCSILVAEFRSRVIIFEYIIVFIVVSRQEIALIRIRAEHPIERFISEGRTLELLKSLVIFRHKP